jgi:starch synthase
MARPLIDQIEDMLVPNPYKSPQKPLKILIVGAEVSPFANVGGYARVLGYLSVALKKLGHDVRVYMPKFGFIDESVYPMEKIIDGLKVPTDSDEKSDLICNVKMHLTEDRIPVYFLENQEYYELRANVYGYKDDPVRWALLSRSVLEFLKVSDWQPNVVHANDWHTGHIPNYLQLRKDTPGFRSVATMFTIHNLMMHGWYINPVRDRVSEMETDDGHSDIAPLLSERLKQQNFLRRGIMYADLLTTVSPTYAKEILKPEFGEGLDRLLTEVRGKLYGVLNGVDYERFDPQTDKLIEENFSQLTLEDRVKNKLALQEEFDLEKNEKIPVLAFVGRMEEQKGVDLIVDVMYPLLKDFNVQFVAVGGGDTRIIDRLNELQSTYPNKVGVHLMPDFTLPRLVFAGADIMLIPSRFEPCGIVQMEAMRYGSVPIVRATGGLADTVKNYEPETDEGWGFVFHEFDAWAFFAQIVRALETYRQEKNWRKIQTRAMSQDNSWESRAKIYVELYEKAIQIHKQGLLGKSKKPEYEYQ